MITKLTIKTYLQLIFAEEEKIFSQWSNDNSNNNNIIIISNGNNQREYNSGNWEDEF